MQGRVVRSLLTWAHGAFKELLKAVAKQYGKLVIEVSAY
ncbi:transposase [Thermostichus sp. MS-CIW-36]